MCDRRRGLGLVSILFLAVLSVEVHAISPDRDDSEILTRLTESGMRIERCLAGVRRDVEHGLASRSVLDREIAEARLVLERLDREIHALPASERLPLTTKLRSVRRLFRNLELAADDPDRIPPTEPRTGLGPVDKNRNIGWTDGPPANDGCDDAFLIGLGTFVGSSEDATNDGSASCGASLDSPDVWYRFHADTSGYYAFDTVGSDFDAVLSLHSGCPGTMTNELDCDDDSIGLQASVRVYLYAGGEVLVRISGFNGASGASTLNVSTGGFITGHVKEASSGTPIDDARVEYYSDTGYYLGSVLSESDGTLLIAGLESGEYFVGTDLYSEPYLDEMFDDHLCPGGPPYGCDPTIGDPVAVTAGSVTAGIDFDLDIGGVITGVVVENGTGLPIDDAAVAVFDHEGDYMKTAYCDATGTYRAENLIAGTYYLVVTSSWWADEAYDDIPCPGGPPGGCDPTAATPVTAALNSVTSGIDFGLDSYGKITGTVTDRATGSPIGYADIQVYDPVGSYVAYGYAEGDGAFTIGGLPDGQYYVTASDYWDYVPQLYDGIDCPPGGCDITSGTPVFIVGQNTAAGIDFDLVEKGSIRGTVIDSTTLLPASGIPVHAYNESGSQIESDYTDSNGVFELYGLDEGVTYVATASSLFKNVLYDGINCYPSCVPTDGTPISVTNGSTVEDINFTLVPLGRITGTVYDQSSGLTAYSRVRLYDSTGMYIGYDYTSSGVYVFGGLPTAGFFLVATNSSSSTYLEQLYQGFACWGGPPNGCDVTTGTSVPSIISTVTSGIDFFLKRRSVISGSVVDAISSAGLSGRVYVHDLAGNSVGYDSFYSGNYSVAGLLPGTYKVIADTDMHVDEVWDDLPCHGEYPDGCDVAAGTSVVLNPGDELTDVDFGVGRLGSIDGVVRDGDDQLPLSSFRVALFDSVGTEVDSDYTSTDGVFEFDGLWPGTYFVATDTNSLTFYDELFDDFPCPGGPPVGCDPITGTPLSLGWGGVISGISLDLDRTAAISGIVVDAGSFDPLPYCRVEVWNSEGINVRSTDTDSNGNYTVRGLAPGTYFVATDEYSSSGLPYLDELYSDIPCPGGPPSGCDATKGTPIQVDHGQTVRFIDFGLVGQTTGVVGTVVDSMTGSPISGIRVDVWSVPSGVFETSAVTNASGRYHLELDAGEYRAATDNLGDWINQIFDGHQCLAGSPFNGDCDPMLGDPVVVIEGEITDDIDFVLDSNSLIFFDGFESGGVGSWSATTP